MKFLLPLVFICNLSIGISQEILNKFQFSLNISSNQSYLSNTLQIKDTRGFVKDETRLGFGVGGTLKYYVKKRLSLSLNLNLYNFEKVSYYYYGSYKSFLTSKPQFGINAEYYLKKELNSIFIFSGVLLSFEIGGGITEFGFVSDNFLLTPSYITIAEDYTLINPLFNIGVGKKIVTKKGRQIEHVLTFHKGFNVISKYTLKRFNPDITSKFYYKGTNLNYTLKWYLKKIQN